MNAVETCIIDTETGGLEPSRPTIQIAAIAVLGWNEVDTFECKVRFKETLAEPEALKLNGYSREVWDREAIAPADAINRLRDWLDGHRVVEKKSARTGGVYTVARIAGWNVRFDIDRLLRGFHKFNAFLPGAVFDELDLVQVARGYFWERTDRPDNLRLETVARHFGIDTIGAHDALADCRLVLGVAEKIMRGES